MNNNERLKLAQKSLLGVSIGDAFGESFFGDLTTMFNHIATQQIPKTSWEFTDDTIMSIAIFEELKENGEIDQDSLIKRFCKKHDMDVMRGYGATLRRVLREIQEGKNWKTVAASAFDGQGSMGNGAAMRVSPIGAYYFDDISKVKALAESSAEVTHTNKEAIAGAIAVAVATALATQIKEKGLTFTPIEFIDRVVEEVPDTDTKAKIAKAKSVSYTYTVNTVTSILGNGVNMTSQDTVPFCIWCAAHNLNNFESAIWKAVSVLGDRDTICAIVGGIIIMSSESSTIPENWLASVEKVEESIFFEN